MLSECYIRRYVSALDGACTPPTGTDADECESDVANSECNNNKCACKDGFIQENGKCPKGNLCG